MPTKNPRLNIVLEKPLYDVIKTLAYGEGISRSIITKAIKLARQYMIDTGIK